jgi:hypothetical protein
MRSFVLIIATLLIVITPFFVVHYITAPICMIWCLSAAETAAESFIVQPGEAKEQLLQRLENEGYIKSKHAYELLSFAHQDYSLIDPGEYILSKSMDIQDVYTILHNPPARTWISVPQFKEIEKLGEFFQKEFALDRIETSKFITHFRNDVRNHFKKIAINILTEANKWEELEIGIAEQLYDSVDYDLFTQTYISGPYLFPEKMLGEDLARLFFKDAGKTLTKTQMTKEKIALFTDLVEHEIEILPDMVPLPPRDIQVTEKDGRTLLIFSSAYWNAGKGPLELVPGNRDENYIGDVRTQIYQRIYRADGTYRSRLAGIFLWHDEHDHYHFDDYMDYVLEPVNGATKIRPIQEKTSFCLRDTELTKKIENAPSKPQYTSCKTNIQGVSVGWGDVYKYTLADQDMDITDLPAGMYRLKFQVNFGNHFDELSRANNISSINLYLDPAHKTVELR